MRLEECDFYKSSNEEDLLLLPFHAAYDCPWCTVLNSKKFLNFINSIKKKNKKYEEDIIKAEMGKKVLQDKNKELKERIEFVSKRAHYWSDQHKINDLDQKIQNQKAEIENLSAALAESKENRKAELQYYKKRVTSLPSHLNQWAEVEKPPEQRKEIARDCPSCDGRGHAICVTDDHMNGMLNRFLSCAWCGRTGINPEFIKQPVETIINRSYLNLLNKLDINSIKQLIANHKQLLVDKISRFFWTSDAIDIVNNIQQDLDKHGLKLRD